MHIAFVRLGATPLVNGDSSKPFGGAEVRCVTFARYLAEHSAHDVTLVVQGNEVCQHGRQGALQVCEVPPRRPQRLATPHWRDRAQSAGRWAAGLWRSVRQRLRHEPGVDERFQRLTADVWCTVGVQHPTPGVVAAARSAGVKSIVFLTSDDDARRTLDQPVDRGRHVRDYRWALLNADAVIVQTEYQQRLVSRAGQTAVFIRNPLDTRLFHEPPANMTDRRYLLWVGRADTHEKRADLCLEVARACPEVPVVMVMNPTDAKTTTALKSNVPANVRLIEHVAWQASDRLFRDAFGLLNTSESEGFPNTFLQAGKFAVPIVSRRVNPDGVLTQHGIGFSADGSLPRLIEIVRTLHREPFRFQQVADRARRYVVDYHHLPTCARQLQTALEAVVDGSLTRTRRRSAA